MKVLLLLLLFAVPLSAQTITSGPKVATGTVTFAVLDTVAVGTRAVNQYKSAGYVFTAADTLKAFNNGKASVVCPPSGFTQAQLDSAFNAGRLQGLKTPPDTLILTYTVSGATVVKTYK